MLKILHSPRQNSRINLSHLVCLFFFCFFLFNLAPVTMLDAWYIEEPSQTGSRSFQIFWRASITQFIHILNAVALLFEHIEEALCFRTRQIPLLICSLAPERRTAHHITRIKVKPLLRSDMYHAVCILVTALLKQNLKGFQVSAYKKKKGFRGNHDVN